MKIERKTITVKIGDEDPAVLVFRLLKANAQQKVRQILLKFDEAKDKTEKNNLQLIQMLSDYYQLILDSCISIENLECDGQPVTIEDIKSQNLYEDTERLIISAYSAALGEMYRRENEAAEKNAAQQGAS